jgi:hypothetical protein
LLLKTVQSSIPEAKISLIGNLMKLRFVFLLCVILAFAVLGLFWSALATGHLVDQGVPPTDAKYSGLLTETFATAYAFVTRNAQSRTDQSTQESAAPTAEHGGAPHK